MDLKGTPVAVKGGTPQAWAITFAKPWSRRVIGCMMNSKGGWGVTVVPNLPLASLRTEMLWGTDGNRCEAGLEEEFCLGPCLAGFYFPTLLELQLDPSPGPRVFLLSLHH